MWELDHEESWALKNWCFWTVVLEKTLESPLDCKDIQPVHFEEDQPWDFFGRNDAKAETPVLWPPHEKSWLIGKDSDSGRDWGQKEKGMTEDEMTGWHHWLDGREFTWVNSWKWWWTGRPGMLRFMGSQRVGHNWATELNWIASSDKNVEKLNHSLITVIIWNGTATPANSLAASYKTKHSILYESAVALLGFILKKWKIMFTQNRYKNV